MSRLIQCIVKELCNLESIILEPSQQARISKFMFTLKEINGLHCWNIEKITINNKNRLDGQSLSVQSAIPLQLDYLLRFALISKYILLE